jgi:hypothetical protein
MSYTPGGTYACCDVCGFQYRLRELKKRWDGVMVCDADYDPRPREHSPPRVKPEGVPLPNARPDNQVDNTPNETTREDL